MLFLQEQGMSGGQQNKDEEIVKMVARMNDLKEKQDGQNEDPQNCLLKMWQTGDCAYRNGKERCAVDDEFAGFYLNVHFSQLFQMQ